MTSLWFDLLQCGEQWQGLIFWGFSKEDEFQDEFDSWFESNYMTSPWFDPVWPVQCAAPASAIHLPPSLVVKCNPSHRQSSPLSSSNSTPLVVKPSFVVIYATPLVIKPALSLVESNPSHHQTSKPSFVVVYATYLFIRLSLSRCQMQLLSSSNPLSLSYMRPTLVIKPALYLVFESNPSQLQTSKPSFVVVYASYHFIRLLLSRCQIQPLVIKPSFVVIYANPWSSNQPSFVVKCDVKPTLSCHPRQPLSIANQLSFVVKCNSPRRRTNSLSFMLCQFAKLLLPSAWLPSTLQQNALSKEGGIFPAGWLQCCSKVPSGERKMSFFNDVAAKYSLERIKELSSMLQ